MPLQAHRPFFEMPYGFCKRDLDRIPIFEMPCGLCKAGSKSMLHFSQCLGTDFARQILIGNVTES
jgi:hypothetical protein